MAVVTERVQPAEFLITEANGDLSRAEIVVITGQNLAAGAVLGKITASGKYTAYDNASALGPEVAAGILIHPVDATSADQKGAAIVRHAEVDGDMLNWGAMAGGDITAGIADLLTQDIVVR